MSGFYSTHAYQNGVVTTVQEHSETEVNIRIQGENEAMLTDIVVGNYEALCLAHSILSVLTHKNVEESGE